MASSVNFTEVTAFFAVIYASLIFFLGIYVTYRNSPTNSPYRVEVVQFMAFLLTIWYSPVLQACAKMASCFNDPEQDSALVLMSDP